MSGDENSPGPALAARASMAWDVVASDVAHVNAGPAASVQRVSGTSTCAVAMPAPVAVARPGRGGPGGGVHCHGCGRRAPGRRGRDHRCRDRCGRPDSRGQVVGGRRSGRAAVAPPGAPRAAGGPEPGAGGEDAGCTVLHDRLVAAHGVSHVLVGPPGVVLVYDYLAGLLWRYRALRLGALVHNVLALLLAVPFVALHRRRLPRLTAATTVRKVTPGADAVRTAAWARSELAVRLGHRPDLDGWTVTVSSFCVLLNRPADRVPEMGNGVGAEDLGHRMLTHVEAAPLTGLTRDAAAFLAVVVDDVCRVGATVVDRLATDLRGAFPDMRGFSRSRASPPILLTSMRAGRLPAPTPATQTKCAAASPTLTPRRHRLRPRELREPLPRRAVVPRLQPALPAPRACGTCPAVRKSSSARSSPATKATTRRARTCPWKTDHPS